MEYVTTLLHDGKRAYLSNGKKFICHDALKERDRKPYELEFTASTVSLPSPEAILTLTKTTSGWTWPMPRARFPVSIHEEGCRILDILFPDAQPNETKTVWCKYTVKKLKK